MLRVNPYQIVTRHLACCLCAAAIAVVGCSSQPIVDDERTERSEPTEQAEPPRQIDEDERPDGDDDAKAVDENEQSDEIPESPMVISDREQVEGDRHDDTDVDGQDTIDPHIEPGELEVEGALNDQIVRQIINQYRRDIQICYERALNQNPVQEGTLTFDWTISPRGDVAAVTVADSTMDRDDVEQCASRQISEWEFPEPDGGGVVDVTFSLDFRTSEAE